MRKFGLSITLLLCGLFWGDLMAADAERKKIKVTTMWHPQAQFAGLYMAKEYGIFEKMGIDVEISHVQSEQSPETFLANGQADIIVAWLLNSMIAASRKADVVQIGQIAQHSGLVIVSRKELPNLKNPKEMIEIQSIKDLSNRRIGIWMTNSLNMPIHALMMRKGLTNYQAIDVLKNVDLFLYEGVDAINAMVYNEYFQIFSAGIEPEEIRVFSLFDEVEIPEDGFYTTAKFMNENNRECRKFLLASLHGWEMAFANPDNTMEIIKQYCHATNTPFNEAHQRWMLSKMEELITDNGEITNGKLNRNSFDAALQIIKDSKLNVENFELVYEKFAPFSSDTTKVKK